MPSFFWGRPSALRHINVEVQIITDAHGNMLYLHIHRRTSASAACSAGTRRSSRTRAVLALGYVRAGTAEFLIDRNSVWSSSTVITLLQRRSNRSQLLTLVDIYVNSFVCRPVLKFDVNTWTKHRPNWSAFRKGPNHGEALEALIVHFPNWSRLLSNCQQFL